MIKLIISHVRLFMIISHVKIIAFITLEKTVVYKINRKLHGGLEIPNLIHNMIFPQHSK